MHLMYTFDAAGKRIYTLKKITASGAVTKSAHPARFSPDDKYSRSVHALLYIPMPLFFDPMMSIWPPIRKTPCGSSPNYKFIQLFLLKPIKISTFSRKHV